MGLSSREISLRVLPLHSTGEQSEPQTRCLLFFYLKDASTLHGSILDYIKTENTSNVQASVF
jgi:hypothetical protein